jgi:hypothetical protein
MRKYIIALLLIAMMLLSTIVSYGASDPAVTIVNPTVSSTIYSTNLLISVKVTQPKIIQVKVTEEKKVINDVYYSTTIDEIEKATLAKELGKPAPVFVSVPVEVADTYITQNYLSFYTKRFEKVTPGTYKIRVETIVNDQVVFSSESLVMMKEKEVETTAAKIFSTPQSGATQFLQNLLKSIFGN